MKIASFPITKIAFTIGLVLFAAIGTAQDIPSGYGISPVPFTSVSINDAFWAPRIKTNHQVTIPIAIQKCIETGRIKNFKIAAKLEPGAFCSQYPFDDSDVFKILEGASYSLQTFPDAQLSSLLDTLIGYISMAQEPDGYLYTNRTIDSLHMHQWVGKKRWEKDPELSHELYNVGHLYEAAVAHFQATGKRSLLDVAIKNANLVYHDFVEGGLTYYPGHQVIEMGLVKLYRVTHDKRYLDLAKYFLDIRHGGDQYNQAHKPVVEQDSIVGHAVRATYMYCGMADVAALTGDAAYTKAIGTIWNDLMQSKYYITGGIGSSGHNEGFGAPYDLPNMSAYAETCASIGNVLWNYRMFLLTGHAKYYDVLERTLYNALLAGVSLSGDRFFYPNPLESRGQHERSAWFGCACCPSNVTRFLPSIPGLVYAHDQQTIFVNLYIQNQASIQMPAGRVDISQTTAYPWQGKVQLQITSAPATPITLALRIPGWATGQAVPTDLYSFSDEAIPAIELLLNGKPVPYTLRDGYAIISHQWSATDVLTLQLPMHPLRILANPKIAVDHNRVALQRGPLVYCLEGIDNPQGHVTNLMIDTAAPVQELFDATLLNGVELLKGEAIAMRHTAEGAIERLPAQTFTAIPYYAWANRGPSEMLVWIPYTANATKPLPLPSLASTSKVSGSLKPKMLAAINDFELPTHSNDHDVLYAHWWPTTNSTEWIQYEFEKPATVSEASVYWFDDGPWGGCRIPKAWKLYYRSNNEWLPVQNLAPYPILKDQLNTVLFSPVTTDGLKLEIQLEKEYSAGLYEWIIN